MDSIFISELKIETRIGIYEWEKKVPQTIQLDIEVGLPGAHAAKSGKIDDTIDYSKIVARIEQLFSDEQFLLLEKAAETIAGIILGEFRAPWVRLSIAKLGALRNVKKLGITIERGKRE
ncbi:MAG: dihydroneopterin aldolase [Betaproteobacteria bacterium]|jgi:dihydroneopterin aldolase|nr:dihydroneopterin aldolase [Betaproteobacteria bacterium]